jgi:hypothetical protein
MGQVIRLNPPLAASAAAPTAVVSDLNGLAGRATHIGGRLSSAPPVRGDGPRRSVGSPAHRGPLSTLSHK